MSETGRLIHTGQVVVDLALRVDRLPERGGDVFARSHKVAVGGAFNVMAAARREGAAVVYLGGVGSGPFGQLALDALAGEGVVFAGPVAPEADTGFSVVLVDGSGERTFVSVAGAETEVFVGAGLGAVGRGEVGPDDLICVSGYSLAHPAKAAELFDWLDAVSPWARRVVDPSPLVGGLEPAVLRRLARAGGPGRRADIWTMNWSEAGALLQLLGARAVSELAGRGAAPHAGTPGAELTAAADAIALAQALGCDVVVRLGELGAVVARAPYGDAATGGGEREAPAAVWAPGWPVDAIDTNGAGDTHCGVMAAALLRGVPLDAAVRRANVAAALATTRFGAAAAPAAAETDAALGA
ncbi:MAG: PfkB family carbohydrate kinase [Bifidobacteriaceae bacterium]|jgi:sugar/nucleoside kinase (ribokinase family)|nr:PfkB family carbohydrate kinase [Bifidobacteriaceae bacterium]